MDIFNHLMMKMTVKRKSFLFIRIMAAMVASSIFSCTKYENPPQVFEEYGEDINGQLNRQVLIINIDGAVGSELEKINPENIAELLQNGKYTFNELSDAVPSDAGTLASMLTGVSSAKHGISDNSYIPINSGGDDHATVTAYPNMFSRLLDVRPEFKTTTITTDAALNKYLITADHRILAATDEEAKDSAINVLAGATDRLFFVDFRDVKAAGISGGFSADAPAYKTAIETTDGYVGELLSAVKARKNYASEDWLIIVTSNRGGDESNPRPGFILCSNINLQGQEIKKAGFNTMHFTGRSISATIKDDNGLYDAGADKDFTVQLQVKFNVETHWPGFFSKSTDVDVHANTGWTMIFNGDTWEVVVGGKSNGGNSYRIGGPVIGAGKWHTLTFTVSKSDGIRTAAIYTDGELSKSADITNAKSISIGEPLKLGYRRQDGDVDGLDFYAADIEYFDKALDAATIKANIALKDITQHPDYPHLVGYWPVDDGAGSVIANLAPVGFNFLMTGNGTWDGLGNDIPVSRTLQEIADGQVSIVATGPDVAALSFYWLKVPINSDWNFDGIPWISNYELEFIK